MYISLILLGLVLINTLSLSLVKIHYELNKDFIVENYCVNLDKPELNCDGQCHLDELLNIISSDNPNYEEVPEANNLHLISIEFFFSETARLSVIENELISFGDLYLNNYTFLKTTFIEKPPIG